MTAGSTQDSAFREFASACAPSLFRSAYAQTVLAREFLSVRRRRSSTERPSADLPETGADDPDSDLRISLVAALAQLPKRERAVIVLQAGRRAGAARATLPDFCAAIN